MCRAIRPPIRGSRSTGIGCLATPFRRGIAAEPRFTSARSVVAAARFSIPHPAGLALSHTSNFSSRSVEITYVLPQDAASVFVGIWNHFAFHVRTLVDGESQKAGRHTVAWDGTDKTGRQLGGDLYICRMSVDGKTGESQSVRLPR
ncbi:FlgD immunoglobulin-like domain containing protein [Bradyrhizobium elkanii]|uniref:FlgD immunoglobulin-like domain containing protein n=1 Tax=Bradyrhizobium elkanii TaxID=29448 RepID=UPI003514D844